MGRLQQEGFFCIAMFESKFYMQFLNMNLPKSNKCNQKGFQINEQSFNNQLHRSIIPNSITWRTITDNMPSEYDSCQDMIAY